MKLNQLKIGFRLHLAFGLVWSLTILLAGVAYLQLESTLEQERLSALQDQRTNLINEWQRLSSINLGRSAGLLVAQGNAELGAYFTPQMKVTSERISAIQQELQAHFTSDADKAMLANIAEQRKTYMAAREAAGKLTDATAIAAALKGQLGAAWQGYAESIDKLVKAQTVLEAERIAGIAASIRRSEWLMGILMLLGIGLGSVMTWSITRSLTAPIERTMHFTRTIATGDLSVPVQIEGNDEISELQTSLSAMQQSLRQVVSNIRSATDSIGTASVQIATGNMDLGHRTEQTASNLQQATSSMDQLTTNVRHSADNARQANQLASNAAEVAARGGEVVSQVVSTMDEINASSKKISDIIGVIDGIAFQTNILALNAAVEAARAGEQGRGFAVVASEVRSLAGRSAEAAKEIKSLIGASVERVETGSRLVEDAGTTMQEIVTSVQRVSDIIGEISSAAAEQSDGISQVNTSVAQLDQATQQNAALVEEGAAAAESLRDQAHRLTQMVSTFKLGAAEQAAARPPVARAAKPAVHKPAVKGSAATTPTPAQRPQTSLPARAAAPAAVSPAPALPSHTPAANTVSDEWETF